MAADGPYTIDGVVPDANTTELADQTGNVKELGPLNSNTTKIGVIHADAVPTLGMTNPNGQVDLRRAWLDTERDTSTQHDWLYFAWERDANSGSGGWVMDAKHSPAIDAADPASPFKLEPSPNGGRANLGADGNSAHASKSPQ